jgi:predicted nucleic acid-binding protein
MIVVADTSPLNYLIQIGYDELLPQIYKRIVVPVGVMEELGHVDAPLEVRGWLTRVPAWIEVQRISLPLDTELEFLGLGERQAIQLAEQQHADLLLIDERKGRSEAIRRGLATTGTLGVLLAAGELGLLDPEPAYRRLLVETTFRTSAALEAQFLGKMRM